MLQRAKRFNQIKENITEFFVSSFTEIKSVNIAYAYIVLDPRIKHIKLCITHYIYTLSNIFFFEKIVSTI